MGRLLFAVLLSAAVLGGCESFFFYPKREPFPNPHLRGVAREDVWVTTPDHVRLHGWILSPAGSPQGTILFLHGNAENITTHVNNVLWLNLAGYQVVLFDYRGYGESEGKASLEGVHEDALAALDAVFRRPETVKDRVAVFGQSLGGAVAVYAVANSPHKERVRALVVDSAFSSYRKIAREKLGHVFFTWPFQYPLSYLFDDGYSPERWIKAVSPIPVVIVHGTADRIVPLEHARRLYREASEPKELWTVKNAGHIMSFASSESRDRLLRFLAGSLP